MPLWRRIAAGLLKVVLPLLLLAVAGWAFLMITATAPGPGRAAPERVARLVEVAVAEPAMQGPLIEAWGELRPARTLRVTAEVAGRVAELAENFRTGATVARGDLLFALDDRDLALALAEAEAEITRIGAEIAIERGQGQRAAGDLARVPTELTPAQRALVLREPQMQQLEAERARAVALRDRAALTLEKAKVYAPFDAVVLDESLAEGAFVTAGEEVASLAGAAAYEVRLAVPAGWLRWLDAQDVGEVRLTQPGVWEPGGFRTGQVLRAAPRLTENGRMAEVIVEVPDPLARQPENAGLPTLLIGSYLRAGLQGSALPDAVRLPRRLLRDGETVWIMTPDDTLEIRPVEVVWRGPDAVLVSEGLAPGERIVATDIAAVAEGMALRTDDAPALVAAEGAR